MKTLNLKRVASLALACVMVLAMAVPSFAANETTITGTYQDVQVDVFVPEEADALINPYGLPIKIGSSNDNNEAEILGQKIVTKKALYIMNESSVDLDVAAKLTVTPSANNIYVISDLTAQSQVNAGVKCIRVNLEVFDSELTDATAVGKSGTESLANNQEFAALVSSDAALTVTPGNPLNEAKSGAVNASGGGDGKVILLKGNKADSNKAVSGGIAYFRLTGYVSDATWTTSDKFTAAIAWTFTPTEITYGDGGTITGAADLQAVGASDTLTIASLPGGNTAVTSVKWTSSDSAKFSVVDAHDDDNPLKATLTKGTAGNGETATITVTFKGNKDHKWYQSTVTVKAGM